MADDFDEAVPREGMTPYRERSTNLRADFSDFETPDHMVSLQEISNGTLGVDLTRAMNALGWRAGEHWVSLTPDNEGDEDVIVLGRIDPDKEEGDPSTQSNLEAIDHSFRGGDSRLRVRIPDRYLHPFSVSSEGYDRDTDPFLFEFFADPDFPDTIILEPVGFASDYLWRNSEFSFPEIDDVIDTVAGEAGVDASELTEWVDRIASEVVVPTFYEYGLSIDESEPDFLSVNGQRVVIVTGPRNEQSTTLLELLGGFYGIQPPMLQAVWQVHQQGAEHLLAELHGGSVPDDHPTTDEYTDAIIIPVTPGGEDGEPGIMAKTITPVAERTVTAVTAGEMPPADAHAWLTDFATKVTNDMVKNSGLRVDREPVNVPYTPPADIPVGYSRVRIHFVEPGAMDELAAEADLPAPAPVMQRAHDEQAERILMALSGVPRDYKTFRKDSHAIVVPIDDDEDSTSQNGTNSESDTAETTQQTLSRNS